MIRRETGGLEVARRHLTGRETFAGRWVAGLLALYTELGFTEGVRRTLRHLLDGNLGRPHRGRAVADRAGVHGRGGAALGDRDAAGALRPFLAAYAGKNLVGGQFVAVFGSADRYLAQVAALLGDLTAAEWHFAAALAMDRRMGSVVHTAETLAAHALALHGGRHRPGPGPRAGRSGPGAGRADRPARVLRRLEPLRRSARPRHLTAREVEVIELLAAGLSNREIGRGSTSAPTPPPTTSAAS